MRRSILIGNLSDWINDLDKPITLTLMKALELQDLLIHCRRELDNEVPDSETKTKKQAKEAIEAHMGKLGIKK